MYFTPIVCKLKFCVGSCLITLFKLMYQILLLWPCQGGQRSSHQRNVLALLSILGTAVPVVKI